MSKIQYRGLLNKHFPAQIANQSGNNSILTIKNQPGWYVFNGGNEAFLVIPQQNGNPYTPTAISDGLTVKEDSSDSLKLSYSDSSQGAPDRYAFTRLTTSTLHQLNQNAFTGGIDSLLTPESQLASELNFSRLFNSNAPVVSPDRATLDFNGAYGLYFQEIFFHIPFLVANTLNANQRFAEAQKWYHYIFNPTQPPLPKPQGYWPLNDNTGTTITDKAGKNNGSLNGTSTSVWQTASDFPTGSRSVLQFDGQSNYILTWQLKRMRRQR